MAILEHQKTDPLMLLAMLLLIGGAFGVSILAPAAMPWAFAAIPLIALLAYWIARWDLMALSWMWVCSFIFLDWDAWKVEIPGFFTMNPPRLIFIGLVIAYLLYFLRRGSMRVDRKVFAVILTLLLYLAWNVTDSGWVSEVSAFRAAPYYRYLGAIMIPLIALWLVYNMVRDEKQVMWPFILLSIAGWYALYIGYLQFAYGGGVHWANSLIWPDYILEANKAIDMERARGPFRGAGMQSTFLVALFYMNLFSARRVRGVFRVLIWVQLLLIPPAIFFTGMRAGYVAFLTCGVVWFLCADRHRAGALKLAIWTTLIVSLATIVFWTNLTSTDRRTGGVAQEGPIRARKILAAQAWKIVQKKPLTGVGFGHFIDEQVKMPHDPQSIAGLRLVMVTQHNVFLTMVSEAGIIGLLLLVGLFLAVFRESLSLYHKIPIDAKGWISREFVVVFWIIMLNFLVCGMFRDMLWEVPSCVLLWSMAGMIIGYNRLLEPYPINLVSGGQVRS
ncbi:MAG: hypothetical protein HN350_20865 [Phycisphaerales bacterium]|jgi:hypothetical protein|nr:hypothetical protein [Phycisphaerales bacterium]